MKPKRLPQRKTLDHSIHYEGRFGACYFLTLCCDRRGQNVLCRSDIAASLLEAARFYHEQTRWWCTVFLLMPDHCHTLVSLAAEVSLSETVRSFKRVTAKTAGIKWQRGFFDHRLRSDESSSEKYEYILANPVRAGLVREGKVGHLSIVRQENRWGQTGRAVKDNRPCLLR